MLNRIYVKLTLVTLLTLMAGLMGCAHPQSPTINTPSKGPNMTRLARGEFDIKMSPLQPYNQSEGAMLGRFSIDKQFRGDLDAVSQGEMLSAGNPATGYGGYVAIERVAGTLNGRKGTFALQQNGTMVQGKPEMNVVVVPGSGTGELTGISGKMTIIIAGGKHSFELEYELPESK